MNDRSAIALCVTLSLAAGALGAFLAAPDQGPQVSARSDWDTAPESEPLDALAAEVRDQGDRIERLSMELANLADQRRSPLPATPAVEVPATAPGGAAATDEQAPAAPDGAVPEDEIALLFTGALDSTAAWEMMDRLRRSGQLDAVLARLSEYAAANPSDPEAQYMEGVAYIMRLQEVGASFEAGPLASKADAAFDRTLALDEDHLGARKSKAISLSFWPPIMGKGPKAIEQFEILIEKQQKFPVQDDFAENYVLLGNLHLQAGNQEGAIAVLEQGLAAHPDDADMAAQLAALKQQ
jgi:tetratricopeptide (TPR) repeat protein